METETSNKIPETLQTPETLQIPKNPETQNRIALAFGKISKYIQIVTSNVRERLKWPLENKEISKELKVFLDEDEDGNPRLIAYNGRVLTKSNKNEKILGITMETDVLIMVEKEITNGNKKTKKFEIYVWNWLNLKKLEEYDEKISIGGKKLAFKNNNGIENYEYKYEDYKFEDYYKGLKGNIREELNKKVKDYKLSTRKDLCLYETKDKNGNYILRGLQYNGELQKLIDSKSPIRIEKIGSDLYTIEGEKESKLLKTKWDESNCEILAVGKEIKRISYNKNGKSYLLNLITVERIDGKFDIYERKNHKLENLILWAKIVEDWRYPGNKPSLKVDNKYLPYGRYRRDVDVEEMNSKNNLSILKFKVNNKKNIYYLVKEDINSILLETENKLEFLNGTNFISEKTKNGYKVYIRQNADPEKGSKVGLYELWEFIDIEFSEWVLECYKRNNWGVIKKPYRTDYQVRNEPHVNLKKTKYNLYFKRHMPSQPTK